jgi:hypothetical protein
LNSLHSEEDKSSFTKNKNKTHIADKTHFSLKKKRKLKTLKQENSAISPNQNPSCIRNLDRSHFSIQLKTDRINQNLTGKRSGLRRRPPQTVSNSSTISFHFISVFSNFHSPLL